MGNMINCSECGSPLDRRVFCDSLCKMKHTRKVTQSNKGVTKSNKVVTKGNSVTDSNLTDATEMLQKPKEKKIGKKEKKNPFGICAKHGGSMYRTCHC